jgi:SAM-dependent methyltransferase
MTDRQIFYDRLAPSRVPASRRAYPHLVSRYFSFLIPPGARVLEIGCGLGDLLAAVKPAYGVGIDFSPAMIELARMRHPALTFHVADALTFETNEPFDYVILSDLVNDLPDVQAVLERVRLVSQPGTRVVINFFNNVWRPVLALAERLGGKSPSPQQNWLSSSDMLNLLHLAGWEIVKQDARILWPMRTPIVATVCNRWLAPLMRPLCLTVLMVARPRPERASRAEGPRPERASRVERPHADPSAEFTCSVVIPARNEMGNIVAAVARTPQMGRGTEIIFIEGHSTDGTWDEIQRVQREHPGLAIKVLKQQSKGKGGAVREAFAVATGDILFILDADLTMPPEELPKFYEVIRSGLADFVNGVRLVYPMQDEAMRFANMVANHFFSLAFSWLLGQRIKDTLCGTKVMFRRDYEVLAANRGYFGDFDPFGDFDLLFGAAKLNLKIVDLPIRYQARQYGSTNIQRWRHGVLLLRMAFVAAARLKFIA